MSRAFKRIAIVNRGEAAMRLIHAVREFNREHDLDLQTIAIYTEPELKAMFVREADDAVYLGPASFVDERDGERKNAYLNYAGLERALIESQADAVWVGWGFVAEHPDFADLCEKKLDLVFIGPDGDCMRRLGDKITSKELAEKAGVPVAPWSRGPVRTLEEARDQADRIGFPLMIKATAGGGGRGIRAVGAADGLDEAFARATSEALKSFGDATVFMERLVAGARHIEVQVIADDHGNVWSVGVRDCSVQRRNQKLIEESSSPVLTLEQEEDVKVAAARLCREAGYRNAGTVEFLYDPGTKSFAFMEVNARLQVEHPVTEVSTDIDLVKLQLHVARGGRLEGDPPDAKGNAIEVRLNAEDPDNDFAPAPGRVELLRLPTGAGVRVDTGVEQGDRIPAEFDSMIAKIIASGRDRNEALARLRRALSELAVVVRGGTTNRAFLLDLLGLPEVVDGTADVGWLDRKPPSAWQRCRPHGQIAVILAAIEVYEEEFDAERSVFLASAARGRPKLPAEVGKAVELRYGGNRYQLTVFRYGGRLYRVEVDGQSLKIDAEPLSKFERRVVCGGRTYRTLSIAEGVDYQIEVDGVPHRVSRDDAGMVRSPAPAVVVSVKVRPGNEVTRGDTLAVLEAMKLEMHVSAPFSGTVRDIEVADNEQVDAGAPLLRIKASSSAQEEAASDRLSFPCFNEQALHAASVRERCGETLAELQFLVLGFDVDPATSTRLIAESAKLCRQLPPDDEELCRFEELLLTRFADLCALSQRRPQPEEEEGLPVVATRSPQESLFTYLRALQTRGEGLSVDFLNNLRRSLAHYMIRDLDPSPELEEVLLWIHKSHSRVEHQIPAILAVLERWLMHVDTLLPQLSEGFRPLLDRLIAVSQGRFPAVADLAREVYYEYFDKPLFEQVRQSAYLEAEEELDYLARDPLAPDREAHMDALVQCPQPLMTLLGEWYLTANERSRELILECLTRRYYRIRGLENVRVVSVDGHPVVTAEYDHEGDRIHLIATQADYADLTNTGTAIKQVLADVPDHHRIVLDFYLHRTEIVEGETEQDTLEYVQKAIQDIGFQRAIRRILTSVRIPGAGLGMSGQQFFTFRTSESGCKEQAVYRGLHPMMAKRLHLWRLGNFELERLPSGEDMYLFHGVARENPKDERLFAVAEVRDVTPVHDDAGRVVGLPYLERMFHEALAGIRLFQSHRPARKRLHWNRVLLYIWPPLHLKPAELRYLVEKLTPATVGLGLEKVVVRVKLARAGDGDLRDTVIHISNTGGRRPVIEFMEPADMPVRSLTPYRQKVVKMRQRGLDYPYEITRLLTPNAEGQESAYPPGSFTEYDFDERGVLAPVDRPAGLNTANVVIGSITNYTEKYPEGMTRIMILGDPSRGMGSLAEPECSRIIAALDLAETMAVPVEWFAVSAGAKIAMDSGTENLDWTARVLRRLIEFTQAGGEVNLIVHGINVGAQSYWNAEATMLMHTRGILIMTPGGAMVLTGKQALDYSGGVSAEDNLGIGGYDRIMGPNGEAQYWAADIEEACRILLRYYNHSYVMPGERFPRRVATTDPSERAVTGYAYGSEKGGGFTTVGEIFSDEHNPGRKKPFETRKVMRAVIDQDHAPLERWSAMRDGEIGVVWDAHLGGYPVCLIGLESKPLPRAGFVPADGPEQWTAGTLFPQSSRKVAWAINSASRNRPVVVLANLSGFDGSPESMRDWQLEYGAEIGRAIVNFVGPIVFCVISRYHGGAFVVFSKSLNANMEVAALDGAYASVIGGAPAAAVVFAREVRAQTNSDPRIKRLQEQLETAEGPDRAPLLAEYEELYKAVQNEKRGQLAEEFDRIHSVQRAKKVGSVDRIIPPERLRPYLIDAVARGIERELGKHEGPAKRTAGGDESSLSHPEHERPRGRAEGLADDR